MGFKSLLFDVVLTAVVLMLLAIAGWCVLFRMWRTNRPVMMPRHWRPPVDRRGI